MASKSVNLYQAASQVIPDGSWGVLDLDVTRIEDAAEWTGSLASGTITQDNDGTVILIGTVTGEVTSTGYGPFQARLESDTGGGFSAIAGATTLGHCDSPLTTDDRGTAFLFASIAGAAGDAYRTSMREDVSFASETPSGNGGNLVGFAAPDVTCYAIGRADLTGTGSFDVVPITGAGGLVETGYSVAADEITVTDAGDYLVLYRVRWGKTADTDIQSFIRLSADDGGGWAVVPVSAVGAHPGYRFGEGSNASGSMIRTFTAGEKLRMEANAASSAFVDADGTAILLVKLPAGYQGFSGVEATPAAPSTSLAPVEIDTERVNNGFTHAASSPTVTTPAEAGDYLVLGLFQARWTGGAAGSVRGEARAGGASTSGTLTYGSGYTPGDTSHAHTPHIAAYGASTDLALYGAVSTSPAGASGSSLTILRMDTLYPASGMTPGSAVAISNGSAWALPSSWGEAPLDAIRHVNAVDWTVTGNTLEQNLDGTVIVLGSLFVEAPNTYLNCAMRLDVDTGAGFAAAAVTTTGAGIALNFGSQLAFGAFAGVAGNAYRLAAQELAAGSVTAPVQGASLQGWAAQGDVYWATATGPAAAFTSDTTVELTPQLAEGAYVLHGTTEIELPNTATYLILYQLTATRTSTGGAMVECRLEEDSGGAFALVPGSQVQGRTGSTTNTPQGISGAVLHTATAGDRVRLNAWTNTSDARISANGTAILIVELPPTYEGISGYQGGSTNTPGGYEPIPIDATPVKQGFTHTSGDFRIATPAKDTICLVVGQPWGQAPGNGDVRGKLVRNGADVIGLAGITGNSTVGATNRTGLFGSVQAIKQGTIWMEAYSFDETSSAGQIVSGSNLAVLVLEDGTPEPSSGFVRATGIQTAYEGDTGYVRAVGLNTTYEGDTGYVRAYGLMVVYDDTVPGPPGGGIQGGQIQPGLGTQGYNGIQAHLPWPEG